MPRKKVAPPDLTPPQHLSARAQSLWKSLVPSRARSIGRMELLRAALEALDRAETARAVIAVEGMTTTTKSTGAVHLHPLVKVERESRAQFAKIWQDQLHFGFDAALDGMQESPYWEQGEES